MMKILKINYLIQEKKKKKRQRSALDQTKWEGKTSGLRGRARALESYHV
jgi:hypothetical protein